MILTWDHQITN